MPTTNCGAETKTKEVTISAWSTARPRRTAAAMPIVIPMHDLAEDRAAMSRSVAGSRDQISVATSVFCA